MNFTFPLDFSRMNRLFKAAFLFVLLIVGTILLLLVNSLLDTPNDATGISREADRSATAGEHYVLQQQRDFVKQEHFAAGGLFEGFLPEQEIMEKRSQNAKHFGNVDGSITVQIGRNVHYLDEKGHWKNIDLTIAQGTSYPEYSFRNETNTIKSYFPVHPGKKGVMMKVQEGTDFNWWANPSLRFIHNDQVVKSITPRTVRGTAIGDKIIYPEIYTGISEEFIMLAEGMESNTIIHSLMPDMPSNSMLEFEHFVGLEQGWEVLVNGEVKTSDFQADQLFIRIPGMSNGVNFGRIVVFDNNIPKEEALLVNMPANKLDADLRDKLQRSVYTVDYRVKFVDGGMKIITQLPAAWLQSSSRVFPVTIDPTVTITPAAVESNFFGPLSHWYGYQRHASLYLQSEIGDYGSITQIEYNNTTPGIARSVPTRVFMRTTASTALSGLNAWNSLTYTGDGAVLCLDQPTNQGNSEGWKALSLTTPFSYAEGNLLIMVSDFWGGSGSIKHYSMSPNAMARQAKSREDVSDPGEAAEMTPENYLSEIRITYGAIAPCSGTPPAGVATASVSSICPETPFTLNLAGAVSGSGVTFQWQASTDNGLTWESLGSAQPAPNLTIQQSQPTQYRAVATCTNTGDSSTSNIVTVDLEDLPDYYCQPIFNFECGDGDVIKNVTFGGINNDSDCAIAISGYTDYSKSIVPAIVEGGDTVPISVLVGPSGGGWMYESVMVGIDYNQNGKIDSLENEYTVVGVGLNEVLTKNIEIPWDALPGTTRMRVVVAATSIPNSVFLCGATNSTSYGEMEDYAVTILPATRVNKVVVSTEGGVPSEIDSTTGSLQLEAAVLPLHLNQGVTWSIIPETGSASISPTGLVTAQTVGTVWAKAVSQSDVLKADSILITIKPKNIKAVATFPTMTVEYATLFADLALPKTVEVTYENDSKEQLSVSWNEADYGAVLGSYRLTGVLALPNHASNGNNLPVHFNVIVEDTTLPTVSTRNLIVALDVNGEAGITPQMIDNGSTDAGGIATWALDKQRFVKADIGIHTVTLTVTDNSGNEETDQATVVVVDFDDASVVYDGRDISLEISGTLPAGVTVNYLNNGHRNVGRQEVKAIITGGTDYNDLELTAELNITKAELIIAVESGQHKMYGNTDPILIYFESGWKGSDNRSILTGELTRESGEEVDIYAITLGDLSAGPNYNIKFSGADFSINKASIPDLTFSNTIFVYDGTEKKIEITGTLPPGTSVSYNDPTRTEAGKQTIIATIDGGDNHEGEVLIATLEITKALIPGIRFEDATFPYDGTEKKIEIAGTLPSGTSVSYDDSIRTDAGRYTVIAMIEGGNNYEDQVLTATLEISKAPILGLTFSDASFAYDGIEQSISIAGQLPQDATVTYSGNEQTQAGEYLVSARIRQVNYQDLDLQARLTITKAAISGIAFSDDSFVYDGIEKTLSIAGTLPPGASVHYTHEKRTDVGKQRVIAIIDGGVNYEDLVLAAELEISKAPIPGITFANASFVYDGTEKSVFISGQLPQNAMVTYSGNEQTQAGEYLINARISQANYQDLDLGAILTITKAEAKITADLVQRHDYDGTVKNVQASLNHGETALTYSREQGYAKAGTYAIIVSAAETDNYFGTSQEVQLNIEQEDLSDLVFKGKTVSYTGEVQRLTVEKIPEAWQVSYQGNDQTDVGNYMVTATISRSGYPEKVMTANLIISKASQEISFEEVGTVSRDAGRVALQVSSSSGLPISLTSDDSFVATVVEQDLLIHRLGTVRITAHQPGDKNHEAAEPVNITVRVADEEEGPVKVSKVMSPNGDGINDILILEGIADYPENHLQILSRSGLLLYESEGYDNETNAFRGVSNTRFSTEVLPEGTYFYVLKFRDGGKWRSKKGWFVLKMNY